MDALCKKTRVKIEKGELRFGVWLQIATEKFESAGWRWRHW
jgi:hypothetical protein